MSEFLAAYDACRRAHYNAEVEPKRPAFQIAYVHAQSLEHLLHRVRVAVVQGGFRCQSRLHLVNKLVTGVFLHYFVYKILAFRPRPDKRHVAPQHVPQLRKLVKMVLAQKPLRACGVFLVALGNEHRLVATPAHRPEFIYGKRLSALAYPLLREYCRAVALGFKQYTYHKHQRRQHHDADKGEHKVQQAFDPMLPHSHCVSHVNVPADHACARMSTSCQFHRKYVLLTFIITQISQNCCKDSIFYSKKSLLTAFKCHYVTWLHHFQAAFEQPLKKSLRNCLATNTLQKAVFQAVKSRLLQPERRPFAMRNAAFRIYTRLMPCGRRRFHKARAHG